MLDTVPARRTAFFNFQEWKSPYVVGWGVVALITCLALTSFLMGYGEKLEEWEHASAIVRNGFIVFGGVVGFVLAIVRIQQTDDQISVAKSEADGRENERIRESFQQAVAMLYGKEEATKPFAIEQIKRVALGYPEQHLYQAISLLCGFARKNSPLPIIPTEGEEASIEEIRVFGMATQCLDVVFELSAAFELQGRGRAPIDLRNTNLSGRTIRGITFNEDSIGGSCMTEVRFERCTFVGQFSRDTTFFEVTFKWVDFDGTYFDGGSFEKAKFFDCTMTKAQWRGNSFEDGWIQNGQIEEGDDWILSNCNLTDCNFVLTQGRQPLAAGKRRFLASDFHMCFSKATRPPKGLENNVPPLAVEVGEDRTPYMKKLTFFECDTTAHNN